MRIAFYGSRLLSSSCNEVAAHYRGLLRELAALGHEIHVYEPHVQDRQKHREGPPPWAGVTVHPVTAAGLGQASAAAAQAQVVVKASGVGAFDDELLERVMAAAPVDALRVFWDVDTAATLHEIRGQPGHALRRSLPQLDLVLTHGGGDQVVRDYRALGARRCVPVYAALDPRLHHPVTPEPGFEGDLGFLGDRSPDREQQVDEFFLGAARRAPAARFLLGGGGWQDSALPSNVRALGHVGMAQHNAFNCTPLAVLDVSRKSMAQVGFPVAARMLAAAGAGACLMTDAWEGIELFLKPGEEVLVARDGADVAELLLGLTPERARDIGRAALGRVLAEHTCTLRSAQVDSLFREAAARLRDRCAA